ncbi:hypothetical protein PRIPAC_89813 [Pristionchus pacificus]|uniref:Uncharacterized protein n=1 Tax=Pristionchus pacificus TaxID=54126 RepID=A0A2A6B835_PRIPA|nr:hypothetical protein PRIPAC_89813 [Pristionchus pacificus]|eukprot:PDM62050.1 hypothetical protein PRIPAC_51492 [Pristionchus pacificus]
MLGWTAIAYYICAIYSFFKSMDIYLDGNRKKLETMRRDNKYETSKDPKDQEIEDKVWRNLIPCMIGAPLQCLYSISMISILAFDDKILKYVNLVLLVANLIANIHQSLRCDQPFLAWQLKWRMMTFRPLKEEFNKYSYLTTSEHFAKRSKALYKKNQQERLELEEAQRKEELDKIKDKIKKFQELGIPRQFHPHLPMKGPAPLKNYEYDPCEKDYIPEREREWKFCEWTKEYLGARVKLTITVADAIRYVKNGLEDCGFLRGDDCPKKQAETMFKEWSDMMELQDGMDFVEPTDAEKVFYDNIPAQFYNDMRGLSVACRVKEAGVDMKKQRLLEPVNQIFTFSCPEKEEAGLGLWADPFGFLWEKNIIKDLPVITREQENTVWNAIMNDYRKHNRLRDMIYDDDTLYSTLTRREVKGEKEVKKKDLEKKRMNRKKKGRFGRKREMKKDVEMGEEEEEEEEKEVQEQPWEAALRKEMNVQLAFPEGPKATHSINPRKHAVNFAELKQNRPNFVGPRQPQFYIPCGPRVRRFWLENYYAPRRELIFRMLCEQAGVRRHNWITRNFLRGRQ